MNLLDHWYQKSHISYAIGWIVAYVLLSSVADGASDSLGVPKLVTTLIQVVMVLVLWGWVRHARLEETLSMCPPKASSSRMLFYLPLVIIATKKVWLGFATNGSPLEGACWVASMCCVGFLEEIIFRGLLFRAMEPDGRTSAIVVSSITFGLGHIVNLFNASGQTLAETVAQIVFAVSVGFMLVTVMLKSGSIWPCVGFHMVNNALSFFENENAAIALFGSNEMVLIYSIGISMVVAALYIAWLLHLPDKA